MLALRLRVCAVQLYLHASPDRPAPPPTRPPGLHAGRACRAPPLSPQGGQLLLADPPNRTAQLRERFLDAVTATPTAGCSGSSALRLVVDECVVTACEVSKLDPEVKGGLGPTTEMVPVQLLVLRSVLGGDTVGLKGRGAAA